MVAHLDAVTSLAVDPNGLYLLSGSKLVYSFIYLFIYLFIHSLFVMSFTILIKDNCFHRSHFSAFYTYRLRPAIMVKAMN